MNSLTKYLGSENSRSTKTARLEARLTQEQKELLLEAAQISGFSLTEFVVASAVEAAKRTIQEQTVLKLSKNDSEVFVNALLNPPEPGEKLRESAKRYKQSQSYHI
ncbi:DUF1778 domain-containing protein [Kamptonema sp. UHCC 0994]|uniref:type II toxin-antitoxin system TacA family antitoxin n=1 Tax=Kamptonema sp. UHCC 0994 TaxID=3031329 RepID=UPI0023BA3379|nr:DUF1778 domain-containing protein [Kamptonema sp. UHCC 0994]MDF0551675.1 DUF1778 domain-containing protein [Kamptonema sp. UHCC 0994]